MTFETHTIKTVGLERISDETYRMIILVITDGVPTVNSIYEGDLATLNFVLDSEHPETEAVERIWSDRVYPDCLSVFETAEAMMADLREAA